MELARLEAAIQSIEELQGRMQSVTPLAAKAPVFADLSVSLRAEVAECFPSTLYSHQAASVEAWRQGRDVVVTSGTGSGKSLCYMLPIAQTMMSEPSARALVLFPTKALAQDQLGKFVSSLGHLGVRTSTYDGDTPARQRAPIRKSAHVVLTNPDMLHVGILPAHEQWGHFLRSLRVIVVDELHSYRGVFGAHVAHVLRRLLRLCRWYGSSPQVIMASATLRHPDVIARSFLGRDAQAITEDGGPQGERRIYWISTDDADGIVISPTKLVARTTTELVRAGAKALIFCRSRVSTEMAVRQIRSQLAPNEVDMVDSYRGGYSAKERREIEQRFLSGSLSALVATNAMELGVDVGAIDSVILHGIPGRVASFWQQIGRAGRGGQPSIALAIAHDDPLEQFYLRNPSYLTNAVVESSAVAVDQPHIRQPQLRCAAYERPISSDEQLRYWPNALGQLKDMEQAGEIQFSADRWFYPSHDSPAKNVNIRGASSDTVQLIVSGEELGSMEYWRAIQQAHAGAIYMHRGQTYVVENLDLNARQASLRRADTNTYTMPIVQSIVEPEITVESSENIALVAAKVTTAMLGYRTIDLESRTIIGETALDMPTQALQTISLQVTWPVNMNDEMLGDITAMHGLQHVLHTVAPAIAGCDRQDFGSAWYGLFAPTMESAVFLFDVVEGGIGLSESLYAKRNELLLAAQHLLAGCGCDDGCPRCLLSSSCESANENLSRRLTLERLNLMLDG